MNKMKDEYYVCVICDMTHSFSDVQPNWRCPKCNELVDIYGQLNKKVKYKDTDTNKVIVIRKDPKQIPHGSSIVFGDDTLKEVVEKYPNENSSNKKLALRGYGTTQNLKNADQVVGIWKMQNNKPVHT